MPLCGAGEGRGGACLPLTRRMKRKKMARGLTLVSSYYALCPVTRTAPGKCVPTAPYNNRHCSHLHWTEEKQVARGEVTCLSAHGLHVAGTGSEPRLLSTPLTLKAWGGRVPQLRAGTSGRVFVVPRCICRPAAHTRRAVGNMPKIPRHLTGARAFENASVFPKLRSAGPSRCFRASLSFNHFSLQI